MNVVQAMKDAPFDASREALFENYTSTCFGLREADQQGVFKAYSANFFDLLPSDKNARILDIGSGLGLLLRWLTGHGFKAAEGVEISQEQVDACHKAGIVNTRKISDLTAELTRLPRTFDLVFMCDVLEHIPKDDTIAVLKALRGALRPGGRAVFKVPNMASLSGNIRRYGDFTHEFGYTQQSLNQVLRMAGFDDVEVRAERYGFEGTPKGKLFLLARGTLHLALKAALFLECPGDAQPTIYTKNVLAVARRA